MRFAFIFDVTDVPDVVGDEQRRAFAKAVCRSEFKDTLQVFLFVEKEIRMKRIQILNMIQNAATAVPQHREERRMTRAIRRRKSSLLKAV